MGCVVIRIVYQDTIGHDRWARAFNCGDDEDDDEENGEAAVLALLPPTSGASGETGYVRDGEQCWWWTERRLED